MDIVTDHLYDVGGVNNTSDSSFINHIASNDGLTTFYISREGY
jgi:hypothetical protein